MSFITMQIAKKQQLLQSIHIKKKQCHKPDRKKRRDKKNGYSEAKVTKDWIEWETSEVATLLLRYAFIIASLLYSQCAKKWMRKMWNDSK